MKNKQQPLLVKGPCNSSTCQNVHVLIVLVKSPFITSACQKSTYYLSKINKYHYLPAACHVLLKLLLVKSYFACQNQQQKLVSLLNVDCRCITEPRKSDIIVTFQSSFCNFHLLVFLVTRWNISDIYVPSLCSNLRGNIRLFKY